MPFAGMTDTYWGVGTGPVGWEGDPQEQQAPNVGYVIRVCLVSNLPVHSENEEG